MKTLITAWAIALLMIASQSLFAADYYTGKTKVSYGNSSYIVTDDGVSSSGDGTLIISNQLNHYPNEMQYELGTNPIQYYNYAMGMAQNAVVTTDVLIGIVRRVFSDKDIVNYFQNKGIGVVLYLNPDSGRVLEVEFYVHYKANDKTILGIPIRQFYQLEQEFKNLTLTITPKMRKQKQSFSKAECRINYELYDIISADPDFNKKRVTNPRNSRNSLVEAER